MFHSVTTGASNDIEQATKLARSMISRFGMSDEFGFVAFETVSNQYLSPARSLWTSWSGRPCRSRNNETKKRTPLRGLRGVRLSDNRFYSAAATSWTSTGALPGRVARPMAARAPMPASPSCSYSQPETISPTLAWVV